MSNTVNLPVSESKALAFVLKIVIGVWEWYDEHRTTTEKLSDFRNALLRGLDTAMSLCGNILSGYPVEFLTRLYNFIDDDTWWGMLHDFVIYLFDKHEEFTVLDEEDEETNECRALSEQLGESNLLLLIRVMMTIIQFIRTVQDCGEESPDYVFDRPEFTMIEESL